MEKFVEFNRFENYDTASELIEVLESNNIEFKIEDNISQFDIAASSINPFDKQIIVNIKESDFEKVNLLTSNKIINNETSNEIKSNYLYTFSDIDLIDVIANPAEWTTEEVKLANQIIIEKGIKPTAEQIKSCRKEIIKEKTEAERKELNSVKSGYSWFFAIGIFSIINTVDFAIRQKQILKAVGLGLTLVVDGVFIAFKEPNSLLHTLINLFISSIFILFWYLAKKQIKGVYLTGLIIYLIDSTIFLLARDWFSFGFHVFVLIGVVNGYNLYLKRKKSMHNSNLLQAGFNNEVK